jgi:starch synthase/alpha-amylase
VESQRGNGFVFDIYDAQGLFWAIEEAMVFYTLPDGVKNPQIERIMTESSATFTHDVTARRYIGLYEKMLDRPLIPRSPLG